MPFHPKYNVKGVLVNGYGIYSEPLTNEILAKVNTSYKNIIKNQKAKISTKLENKVALITEGGSGISKAIALVYASEGAKIVVSDINETGGNETVSHIKSKGGDAIFVKADTSNPEDSKNMVAQAVKQFGGLH